jgi:tyrosinase
MAIIHSMLFLYILAILPNAHLSYAREGNETQVPKCSKLLARKEWRTLTHSEKAEWVGAVNVRPPSSLGCVYVADCE